MSSAHLAQVNLALAREPLDAPLLDDFMAALAPVHARPDQARLRANGPTQHAFTFRRHIRPMAPRWSATTGRLCPA
ncbi:MAG: hypothetical protein H0W09_07620 [Solirubrobacterales bacterium]|nr:hypothetical protein [Solirubrobacterales bacterium]